MLDQHAIFYLIDRATSDREWLAQQAPSAEIHLVPHVW